MIRRDAPVGRPTDSAAAILPLPGVGARPVVYASTAEAPMPPPQL